MTQIGEGIAITQVRLDEGKCVFCGEDEHEFPKKDVIKATGWKRAKIAGVGGRFSGAKLDLYPKQVTPPTAYKSEGHHCLAFSSFIIGAQSSPPNPRDRFAALNHYLKEKNYDPNNINNVIDLPGRKEKGEEDPRSHYMEFTIAVEKEKPLQVHIGGHADKFMNASNVLLLDIVSTIQENKLCGKPDDEFKNKLLKKVENAEDKAFKKTAGAISPWICHPAHINKAKEFANDMLNRTEEIKFPKL
ncbi:hypothetical protein [Teredinibacter haidensis]|uniref:hypothetical protein n=1 Tax=Teredinibacter haidensis TaxID=2731755 RepID=UPI0009490A40|nr:hypothetical protein [Teredinibacter haidensis]